MLKFLRSRSLPVDFDLQKSKPLLPKKSVFLGITAITILAVGTTAFFSYRIVRRLILDSLKANALLQVQKSGHEIDEWLTKLVAQVESAGNQAAVRSMNWAQAKPQLQLELDRLPDFTAFALVNPDGTYYTTKVDFVKGRDLRDRDHFQRSMIGKTTISDLIVARSTGIRQIVLGVPIWSVPPYQRSTAPLPEEQKTREKNLALVGIQNPQQPVRPIGELFGTLAVDHIGRVVTKIADRKGSYAFAIDSTGVLLAHPNSERLQLDTSLLQDADRNLAAIARSMVNGDRGVQLLQLEGQWVYVAYAPLSNTRWSIAQVIPQYYLEAQLSALNVLAIVLGGVLLLAAAIAIRLILLFDQTHQRAEAEALQARQLSEALQNLQQTQSQLIQSEKMSSLGQMVAGVAHEINNPVNFIYGNLNHVDEYTHQLLELIQLYQEHYANPAEPILEEIDKIELEFIVTDLPKMVSSMKLGADRIRQIVLSLRNFSRLDEAEMKAVNIHEGIDSTLLILQHRLKAKPDHPSIEVIKEYAELPLVTCYAGQLNQVFMNILSNAIDALESRDQQRSASEMATSPSTITIRTHRTPTDRIAIQIADNGLGIDETVKKRLFDPFFTTKPVGKGTGLGLSISYQIIVEKHGGSLRCEAELGKGCEFWIEIPIKQSNQPTPAELQPALTYL